MYPCTQKNNIKYIVELLFFVPSGPSRPRHGRAFVPLWPKTGTQGFPKTKFNNLYKNNAIKHASNT